MIIRRTFSSSKKDPKVRMPHETKRVSELSDQQLRNLIRPDNSRTVQRNAAGLATFGGMTGGTIELVRQAKSKGVIKNPNLKGAAAVAVGAGLGSGLSEYGKHHRDKLRKAAKEELKRREK